MKFVITSSELLTHLQAINRVISSKNTLPILDNFMFVLDEETLTVTASDLETTMTTSIQLTQATGEGSIALSARLLTDTLKEFGDQPLTFDINDETLGVDIISQNGKFSIVGQETEEFPKFPELNEEEIQSLMIPAEVLLKGISKTIFATAEDELRPVMNGILIELTEDSMNFVASDAHKLVRMKRTDITSEEESSFILPKKPAGLLKNVLPKESGNVQLQFDSKNAFFTLNEYKMVCRLVEGSYPKYNAVIPKDNPNKAIIDRVELYNSLRRVSVFSNQASNLVRLELEPNQVKVSAQDIDFSISAYENINCQYEGDEMKIGFKSTFLIEILANIPSSDVALEMSDPSRAGIFLPVEKEDENEDILMLLMPMMINV